MKIIKGDIITLAEEGNFDIIVQGCNCFHTQASGLAGQLVKKYPQVLEVDRRGHARRAAANDHNVEFHHIAFGHDLDAQIAELC